MLILLGVTDATNGKRQLINFNHVTRLVDDGNDKTCTFYMVDGEVVTVDENYAGMWHRIANALAEQQDVPLAH